MEIKNILTSCADLVLTPSESKQIQSIFQNVVFDDVQILETFTYSISNKKKEYISPVSILDCFKLEENKGKRTNMTKKNLNVSQIHDKNQANVILKSTFNFFDKFSNPYEPQLNMEYLENVKINKKLIDGEWQDVFALCQFDFDKHGCFNLKPRNVQYCISTFNKISSNPNRNQKKKKRISKVSVVATFTITDDGVLHYSEQVGGINWFSSNNVKLSQ